MHGAGCGARRTARGEDLATRMSNAARRRQPVDPVNVFDRHTKRSSDCRRTGDMGLDEARRGSAPDNVLIETSLCGQFRARQALRDHQIEHRLLNGEFCRHITPSPIMVVSM